MKTEHRTADSIALSQSLAAEDLRKGDFVSVLYQIVEYPSFFWSCDSELFPPSQPIRMQLHPSDCGTPLKIVSTCLPFVFAKRPCGRHQTLDIRQTRLVRLNRDYARTVWKAMSKSRTIA